MANLTTVGITSGVPSSGTGTVSTIDNLLTLGMSLTGGAGSSTVFAVVTGAASSATSSMAGLVVSISPNSVNPNILALSGGTIAAGTAGAPVVGADQYANYIAVSSGQTQASLGTSLGRAGDYLAYVTVFPAAAAAGAVTIFDSTGITIGSFAGGGTTALPSLVPFMIPIGAFSVSSGWKITTSSNVTVLGVGKFT